MHTTTLKLRKYIHKFIIQFFFLYIHIYILYTYTYVFVCRLFLINVYQATPTYDVLYMTSLLGVNTKAHVSYFCIEYENENENQA